MTPYAIKCKLNSNNVLRVIINERATEYQRANDNQRNKHNQEMTALRRPCDTVTMYYKDFDCRFKDIRAKYMKIIPESMCNDIDRPSSSYFIKRRMSSIIKCCFSGTYVGFIDVQRKSVSRTQRGHILGHFQGRDSSYENDIQDKQLSNYNIIRKSHCTRCKLTAQIEFLFVIYSFHFVS